MAGWTKVVMAGCVVSAVVAYGVQQLASLGRSGPCTWSDIDVATLAAVPASSFVEGPITSDLEPTCDVSTPYLLARQLEYRPTAGDGELASQVGEWTFVGRNRWEDDENRCYRTDALRFKSVQVVVGTRGHISISTSASARPCAGY